MKMGNSKKSSCFTKLSVISVLVVGLFCLSTPLPTAAQDITKESILVDKAVLTFKHFMYHPDMAYFKEHLKDVKALLIVPSMIKAGFIIGGEGGRGVLLIRNEKTGAWSGPGFYTIGAGSLGLQIGAQMAQVIFLIKSQKVVESLYSSSFKMGGDISLAAGPVGSGAAAKGLSADIVSFAASKGVFVGMAFDGAVIATSYNANRTYYGTTVNPVDIFESQTVSNPHSAELMERVTEATNSP
jgi:lipid-binding SYLF domain-containing protein